jgi:hypothetical protein
MARCEKNRLHNAARASRPSTPLSPLTDYAGRSITAASTHVLRGRPSCPLRSEEMARCGMNRLHIESTMLQGLQGLLLHSAHRRTTLDTRSLLHRRRASTASHPSHVLRGRPSKMARGEKTRLHNAARALRPAPPLSSPTDRARRSITAALTTDFDCAHIHTLTSTGLSPPRGQALLDHGIHQPHLIS